METHVDEMVLGKKIPRTPYWYKGAYYWLFCAHLSGFSDPEDSTISFHFPRQPSKKKKKKSNVTAGKAFLSALSDT